MPKFAHKILSISGSDYFFIFDILVFKLTVNKGLNREMAALLTDRPELGPTIVQALNYRPCPVNKVNSNFVDIFIINKFKKNRRKSNL
jgi:hypothetical protein